MTTKKISYYKNGSANRDDVSRWVDYNGGDLCVFDVESQSVARNGVDVTSEVAQFMASYSELLNHKGWIHYFSYFDPALDFGALFSSASTRSFDYVGSVNAASGEYKYHATESSGVAPTASQLRIGFSAALGEFIVELDTPMYESLQLRGTGQLVSRYIELRMDRVKRVAIYDLYRDRSDILDIFEDVENTIYDLSIHLYRSYIARFVKKDNVRLKNTEFIFLDAIHKEYLAKRSVSGEREKISVEKVLGRLNSLSPENLYFMSLDFRKGNSAPPESATSPPRQHRRPERQPLLRQPQLSKQKHHVPS